MMTLFSPIFPLKIDIMDEFLATCERSARAAGKVLLDWRPKFAAREKGPRDLVTEADLAAQKAVREVVLGDFPDHDFLGEEDPNAQALQRVAAEGYRWVVDPLDGTTNYVHQLPSYAVSVALERQGTLLAGVVFDPVADECYAATKGGGARLNGEPISTSDCTTLNEALIAASFPARVARDSVEVTRFVEMLVRCQALRRLGSAALNFCYLAAGRLDGYWATSVKSWDVAAGALILQEAGGAIEHFDGGDFQLTDPRFIAASNGELLVRMAEVIR